MHVRIVLILTLILMPFLLGYGVEPVVAGGGTCQVEKVIKLVLAGHPRGAIRKRCTKANVSKCSLTQVIRMAKDGKSSKDIYGECGRSGSRG